MDATDELKLDDLDLNELLGLDFIEHAELMMKVADKNQPIFAQFQAKVQLNRPTDAELIKRSNFAQFSPKKLQEQISTSLSGEISF